MLDNNGMQTEMIEIAAQAAREAGLMTEAEMAELLRVHPSTLQRWRRQGRGPRYVRLGTTPRARIRYVRESL